MSTNQKIAFEGSIGVGKTTLVKKLCESFPDTTALVEPVNNLLLGLFYANPQKYGFSMQLAMLCRRIFQWKLMELRHERLPLRTHLWDRSMLGDLVFGLFNHLLGNLSKPEFDAYIHEFFSCDEDCNPNLFLDFLATHPFIIQLDSIVYLQDSPNRCKDRVENSRGNPCEKDIPLAYYKGLEDVHLALFCKLWESNCETPIAVWEFGTYNTAVESMSRLRESAHAAKVVWCCSADVSALEASFATVYRTIDDLRNAKQKLHPPCSVNSHSPSLHNPVLICGEAARWAAKSYSDLLQTRWKSIAQAVEKQASPVGDRLRFFRSAAKRVIWKHLCDGQTVFLEHADIAPETGSK